MNMKHDSMKQLKVGAAVTNITPKTPHFLYGYPFVERISTGVHDWLLSSALYLSNDDNQLILISGDIIYVDKRLTARVRKSIANQTGVPEENILIAATHTHSGPITVDCIVSANDPIVPKVNEEYLDYLAGQMVKSACMAFERALPAKCTFFKADATGIGTNRHDPAGPQDLEVPVLVFKNLDDDYIASMLVCNMHPTVLHEDSTLFTADFPYFVRSILQKKYFGCECPVIYFTGASGNQSPRHVTRANTFSEAERLGSIVATAIGENLTQQFDLLFEPELKCKQHFINLPFKEFPTVEKAEQNRKFAKEKFLRLKEISDNAQEIRSAEVDWFGSEEIAYLSKLAASGSLTETYKKILPAEIQVIKLGPWSFVAWPGEIFIEYAIELKKQVENTFLITTANGELQGYIPTKEASEKGYYEASNSFFDYKSGDILLDKTIEVLNSML